MNRLDMLAMRAERDTSGVLGANDAEYLRLASRLVEAAWRWYDDTDSANACATLAAACSDLMEQEYGAD